MATRCLRPEFERFPWRHDESGFDAWADAGMRQLWRTDYLPNRARLIVASFLVKHLLIDWRCGEEWFWDTLIDADPANNPLSWQWVAGAGIDSAPSFRIFRCCRRKSSISTAPMCANGSLSLSALRRPTSTVRGTLRTTPCLKRESSWAKPTRSPSSTMPKPRQGARGLWDDAGPLSRRVGSGHLTHLPLADRNPAVHAGGEVQIVRGDEGREAARLDQRCKRAEHTIGGLRVEIAGGLVSQQHPGPVGDRPRDRDPLLFAARQFGRAMALALSETKIRQQLACAGGGLGAREPRDHLRQDKVLERRKLRQQMMELVNETDFRAP